MAKTTTTTEDINGAASKPPQISDMFQKFALDVKTKTFEFFANDDKETPPATGGDSSDGSRLLDSTKEVITDRRVVVVKCDHCRAGTQGREVERACGLSPESTRLAKEQWRQKSCVSGKMNSGDRERGREASSLGRVRTAWGHLSSAKCPAPMVTWKTYFLFFLKSHLDFLSGSKEKCLAKEEMLGHSFAALLAAFVAPVFLYMIAYEHLHWKKACECEVFLSFSGEGALKNFVDSLYKGMVDAGIGVFRNDYWLRRHEKIGFQAIKSSKISIPILSRKYASSRRCLDELVQIMKCKNDSSGNIVWPIFYGVKPTDIRCEIDVCDPKVAKERQRALIEINSLKRWESDKIADGDGGQLVELVVRKVLIELEKALEMVVTENSVGIKSPMNNIMQFLDNRQASTLYVGIHGKGGVGKTTLAKVIYNKLSDQFDYCSFIPNVSESCECNGMKYLQKQLIKDILKQENVQDEKIGNNFSSKFKDKKVLILLDDVITNHELEALVRERNWFASGSRIIITTKNMSVLDWAQVDCVFEHTEMDKNEAKILFDRHAFRRGSPSSEFSDLSDDVVSTIRRFPLTLKVLGSYLRGKSLSSWLDTLENLQRLPQMEVQEILKIVYKALNFEQKKIFLDIACFLVGSDARFTSYMWDTSDSRLLSGIEELIFMSFVKIGDNHELTMHNELRDLGRAIVREGHGNELVKDSRLWEYEEVLEVLEGNTETDNIQALSLNKNSLNPGQSYTYERFKNLVGLRFLHVSGASFQGDLKKMFSKLRWIQWERCLKVLDAQNFGVEELVVLDLSGSMIQDRWKGWSSIMLAKKLKVLNLTGCSSLKSALFLSDFKNLEILILRNCTELEENLPSIGDLETLVSLDLSGCSRLKELPKELGKLEELKELLLDQTNVKEIPSIIGSLKKLEMISAKECVSLVLFLDSPVISSTTVSSDSSLPDSIGSLGKLRCLSLQSCAQLRLIPNSIRKLESLAELALANTKIKELPESIGNLQNLEILNIRSTEIEKLPNAIGSLRKLRELDASKCGNLSKVIPTIRDLCSLQHLNLIGCLKLQSLPELPSKLTVVGVTCKSVILPSFSHLTHLKQLRLHYCKFLECIPELPSTLLELEVMACEKLQFLTPLESLERLDIIRCKSVDQLDLSKLNHLRVFYARNCINIQEIIGLDRLNDLKSLTIQGDPPIELDEPFLPVSKGHYLRH